MSVRRKHITYRIQSFIVLDQSEQEYQIYPTHKNCNHNIILNLLLILIASVVVVIAVNIGWKEVTGFGGQFATAALYLPASMDFSEWFRIPRSWMMASILFGFSWMLLIQLELFARELYALIYGLRPRIDPMVEDSGC